MMMTMILYQKKTKMMIKMINKKNKDKKKLKKRKY